MVYILQGVCVIWVVNSAYYQAEDNEFEYWTGQHSFRRQEMSANPSVFPTLNKIIQYQLTRIGVNYTDYCNITHVCLKCVSCFITQLAILLTLQNHPTLGISSLKLWPYQVNVNYIVLSVTTSTNRSNFSCKWRRNTKSKKWNIFLSIIFSDRFFFNCFLAWWHTKELQHVICK